MVGTSKETEAVETSTAKQEEILDRDIPSVLVAEISPLQNITVQFNDAVDLNTPVATLPQTPQGGPPQGVPVAAPQTNFANPGTTVPPTPVASPYGYPGYGGYAPAPYGSPYIYPAGPGGTLP
jgi:hypothetical protein